ncbi:complex I subunit 1 family protein [Mycobacterium nebraskense]|uniref:NADH dehydrogenase n=1 Tax=Mycobacterium nebraskense TaxID=244292 RepID=A0A0F5N8T1_9MYCO|nr:NADH-quinone oxidoreductase subunit H [Mycobacterium nebraskense]KKC03357.1 NADH dehydrogenase [Mycobacterium nebraskense]KLO46778.1 NADH dehydrogenase [Mycobacterium nebraskense]MBI2696061.1 NADH-quinone oxidoreductase subunit H [Mycobacterium nebraskense]MCV7115743.1 NADH-quinone oxidoreductase subunit H [Mycobacterium nebraskense]ORW35661.1 NADH dehydrogenase [Mycobacterium nebraskense]
MSDAATVVSGVWAPVAAALLCLLGLYAASVDGVLAARRTGVATRGVTTPLLEGARLLRQRRRATVAADTLLWRVGGAGLVVVSLLKVVVVPLGHWTLFNLDVGVVWFNAMDVTVWALVWLAGWGPNSVHSLIGGYRFLAHGLGYELPLMFALVAPAIAAQSLRVGTVVTAQQDLWFVVWMPVAFLGYCLGVVAFAVWGPFSPALGADIAGGVTAELSGADRLVFQGGRYMVLSAGAAFAVPLFLGGGAGPLLPDYLWVLVKTVAVLTVLVWLRRRVPALRPEKFLEFGWMVLLPAVVLQDFVVAFVAVWRG